MKLVDSTPLHFMTISHEIYLQRRVFMPEDDNKEAYILCRQQCMTRLSWLTSEHVYFMTFSEKRTTIYGLSLDNCANLTVKQNAIAQIDMHTCGDCYNYYLPVNALK